MKCKDVLIVEDEAEIRENLRELLELEGYRVHVATNGQEGLRILHSMPRPCIILLDLLMPVMDGSEFLRVKGDDDLIAAIPVAIVSGIAERPELTGGAVGFLRKPFDFEGLLKFIGPYCDPERELNAGEYKDIDPAKNI